MAKRKTQYKSGSLAEEGRFYRTTDSGREEVDPDFNIDPIGPFDKPIRNEFINRIKISERDLHEVHQELRGLSKCKTNINFKKMGRLGEGSFGKVFKVVLLNTDYLGEHFAMKEIKIGEVTRDCDWREQCMLIKREVSIMSSLRHPNIVKFVDAFVQEQSAFILMDLCDGSIKGLTKQFVSTDFTVSEKEKLIQKYTFQICKALEYIHSQNIVHRDIRGDNIGVDNDGVVRLIDFGLAKKIKENWQMNKVSTVNGIQRTPNWIPPELMKEALFGLNADCWSVGATVYEMATGEPPFAEMPSLAITHQAKEGKLLPPDLPAGYSKNAVDFVRNCFTLDPKQRPSSEKLLCHEFMATLRSPIKYRPIESMKTK